MNYEAGFCVFAFIVFCCVLVYALYRRALAVEHSQQLDDVESLPPQHINFRCTLQPIVNIKNTSDELLSRDDVLELAKPASDWIDWHGGECPVPDGTIVDVKWRDGTIHEKQQAWEEGNDPDCDGCSYAGFAFWRHEPQENDIIAYRVCGQVDVPVPKWVQSVSNTAAPMPKGWQPWEGGDCPVSWAQAVVIMRRNGSIESTYGGGETWWHAEIFSGQYDILAYRIAD